MTVAVVILAAVALAAGIGGLVLSILALSILAALAKGRVNDDRT